MGKTKAQTEQILKHLKKGKTITPLTALRKFGCLRLSARIYDLRKQGHPVEMNLASYDGKNFAEYSLRKAG